MALAHRAGRAPGRGGGEADHPYCLKRDSAAVVPCPGEKGTPGQPRRGFNPEHKSLLWSRRKRCGRGVPSWPGAWPHGVHGPQQNSPPHSHTQCKVPSATKRRGASRAADRKVGGSTRWSWHQWGLPEKQMRGCSQSVRSWSVKDKSGGCRTGRGKASDRPAVLAPGKASGEEAGSGRQSLGRDAHVTTCQASPWGAQGQRWCHSIRGTPPWAEVVWPWDPTVLSQCGGCLGRGGPIRMLSWVLKVLTPGVAPPRLP